MTKIKIAVIKAATRAILDAALSAATRGNRKELVLQDPKAVTRATWAVATREAPVTAAAAAAAEAAQEIAVVTVRTVDSTLVKFRIEEMKTCGYERKK